MVPAGGGAGSAAGSGGWGGGGPAAHQCAAQLLGTRATTIITPQNQAGLPEFKDEIIKQLMGKTFFKLLILNLCDPHSPQGHLELPGSRHGECSK